MQRVSDRCGNAVQEAIEAVVVRVIHGVWLDKRMPIYAVWYLETLTDDFPVGEYVLTHMFPMGESIFYLTAMFH